MILRRRVMVSGDEGTDYSKQYLTIVSLGNNNTIKWNCSASNSSYYKRISYSTNGGTTWTSKLSSERGTILATLNTGDKIMLKYNNTSVYASVSYYNYFSSTKDFNLEGNIMSLITSGDFTSAKTISDSYAFKNLFFNCSNLKSAENLVLPATTLADYCYTGMFQGCTALTTPPTILPATTLTTYCYRYMFNGCTALTSAPELPATTLTNQCYYQMFNGCTALNYVKCLATDISATNCTNKWLEGVSLTGIFVKDSSMTSWQSNTSGIPSGWTVQDA